MSVTKVKEQHGKNKKRKTRKKCWDECETHDEATLTQNNMQREWQK